MSDPRSRTDEQFLDLAEDDSLSTEQLDNQVQKAQEQLIALKRAQETLEKQKRELEELSRRQEQLSQGKTEMMEKFTRAIVVRLNQEVVKNLALPEVRERIANVVGSSPEEFTAFIKKELATWSKEAGIRAD